MARVLYRDAQGNEGAVDVGAVGVFIGRATDCAVRAEDAAMSRKHSRIVREANRYWIEDLGSSNGTFVNEARVQKQVLGHGDVIRCGSLAMRFLDDPPGAAPPVSAQPLAQPPASVGVPPTMSGGMPPLATGPRTAAIPAYGQAQAPVRAPTGFTPAVTPQPLASTTPGGGPGTVAPGFAPVGPSAPTTAGGSVDPAEVVRMAGELKTLRGVVQQEQQARARAEEAQRVAAETAARAEDGRRKAEEALAAADAKVREADKLQRRVDQLQADLRRARGGADAPPEAEGAAAEETAKLQAEVQELKAALTRAQAEAGAGAAGAAAAAGAADDLRRAREERDAAKRQVEQLQADLRRARSGEAAPAGGGADPAELAKAREERDQLKRRVGELEFSLGDARRQMAVAPAAASGGDPVALKRAIHEACDGLNDMLSDLRVNLRSAMDEVTAQTPALGQAGAEVIKYALNQIQDFMENAKGTVRNLRQASE